LILNRTQQFSSRSFLTPIFEYVCKACQHEFEALVFGSQKAECPKCQSKKLEPQLSVFAVSAKGGGSSQPSMSAGSPGACGSCGDPRDAGACSMKDFN
jgi:putative FmdB family regulatory protein